MTLVDLTDAEAIELLWDSDPAVPHVVNGSQAEDHEVEAWRSFKANPSPEPK